MVLKRFAVTILLMGALLEALLRLFDPMGVDYLIDLQTVFDQREGDDQDYRFAPGRYDLHNFTMTILPDYRRAVPDSTTDAECTIVAIGDSVTLGWGVDDREAWANLLALHFPDVRFINTGVAGYTSQHILDMQQRWKTEADFFIYYMMPNDVQDGNKIYVSPGITTSSYLLMYAFAGYRRQFPVADSEWSHFEADVKAILEQPTLLFVSYDDFIKKIAPLFGDSFIPIPAYTSINSLTDSHPNPAGHEQIARAMLPYVTQAIERWCD